MQAGSASTVGRRSSVRTLMLTRVRSSDSPPPRDQQRSQTTGSASIPHGGASVTIVRHTAPAGPETTFRAASSMPPTTPQQGRRDLGEDASPSSTSERTCGGMEHGTPDTSAERALFGSGASRLTRLTNGWRSTIQGRRRQPAPTGVGSRTIRGRDGTGTGTGSGADGHRSGRVRPSC